MTVFRERAVAHGVGRLVGVQVRQRAVRGLVHLLVVQHVVSAGIYILGYCSVTSQQQENYSDECCWTDITPFQLLFFHITQKLFWYIFLGETRAGDVARLNSKNVAKQYLCNVLNKQAGGRRIFK